MIHFLIKIHNKLNTILSTPVTKLMLGACGKNCTFKKVKFMGGSRISIGNNVLIQENSTISTWHTYHGNTVDYDTKLEIGDNCSFGSNTHITCINKVMIGSGVLFGNNVTITDNSHGMTDESEIEIRPSERKLYSKGPVIIQDNVWLGDKVTVLPNVTIGRCSIIGANSVVTLVSKVKFVSSL